MNLAYDQHGSQDGSTIVLLHSLAMDRTVWQPVISLLADGARVVACDLPGHGASPPVSEVTVEKMADEVAGLLRSLDGATPSVVVGMSLGGCVAQALAVRHPDLVQGLALLDTTCWYGPGAADTWAERAQRATEQGLASLGDFQLARWFTPAFLDANPEVGPRLLDIFTSNDLASYAASCHAMGAFDYREQVRAINVPTLVVVGADDPATPVAHSQELHDRIATSSLEILPDTSHLSGVERPAEIVKLLNHYVLRRQS